MVDIFNRIKMAMVYSVGLSFSAFFVFTWIVFVSVLFCCCFFIEWTQILQFSFSKLRLEMPSPFDCVRSKRSVSEVCFTRKKEINF